MIHGWDSESVFLIYEIIYEKKAPFSIFGPKSWKHFFIFILFFRSFPFPDQRLESISLYLWNKVEKVKVFFYIYETRFLYFSWKKVQRVKVFLYFHETRLRNVMNRRRLATLSGEISAWSFIQHHLTSTLTWYTGCPKKND